MRELLKQTAEQAIAYLEGLDARGVAPTEDAVARLDAFDQPLAEGPADPQAVLRLLDEFGSPATMAMAGPRFFGMVIGGALPVAVAANWLATAWDQNSALYKVTPATAALEQIALRWLVDLLRLPPGCGGAFVTGATMANFTALAAARHVARAGRLGCRGRWPVRRAADHRRRRLRGASNALQGARPAGAGAQPGGAACRWTSKGVCAPVRCRTWPGRRSSASRRATSIPARSTRSRRSAPAPTTRAPGCMSMARSACGPPPLPRAPSWQRAWRRRGLLGDRCAQMAECALRQRPRICARDAARCARRWRSPPSICRRRAIGATPRTIRPSCRGAARGVEIWAALRSLGRAGLAELVERTCRHARRFAEGLAAAGYQVLNDVVLNQVLVSFGDAETTNACDRRDPGRRYLLVWRHDLAGADGHAHQRLVVGDDRRGYRAQPGGDTAGRRTIQLNPVPVN